jgi:HK97 gp10 family phage protein
MSTHLASINVDFAAIEKAKKLLNQFPTYLQQELGKAVTTLVLIIEAKAKQLCPVDTGNLRSSITPVVVSWAQGYVGTNVEYAPHVEFGTVKSAAQPYFEPAYLEGKKQANRVFNAAVKRAIKRAGR